MLWAYSIPTAGGGTRQAIGCPVWVDVTGLGRIQAVFQFPDASLACAVVHLPSGQVIAPVLDWHRGAPQERAQHAVRDRLGSLTPARVASTLARAPVINEVPAVVGVMRAWRPQGGNPWG